MRFSLQREVLLKPLAQVVNVVERRQTLPVLANLLARVEGDLLSLTGTDLEVEMVARTRVDDAEPGETTIPHASCSRSSVHCLTAAGSPSASPVTRSRCRQVAAVSPWPASLRTTFPATG